MPADFPTWTLPVIALSLLVIAIVLLVLVMGLALALRQVAHRLEEQQNMIREGQALLRTVKEEAEAVVRTSRGVRRAVVRGVKRARAKLLDLEALYDVVHEEVEETALDVASTLRTVRRGGGMLGRIKRLVIPGR